MPTCELVSSFIARQGILLAAGCAFLIFTWARKQLGYENRDLRTFAADCSKQAGQQALGGVLMVLLGMHLAKGGGDALAWYGAQYPFEIVLTTVFTGMLRKATESGARRLLRRRPDWRWLVPFTLFGQYGPSAGDFSCRWYWLQMLQAVVLIGAVARLAALGLVVLSLNVLPSVASPVALIAEAWYHSALSCNQRTALILYVIPLVLDAIQFAIIDALQRLRAPPSAATTPLTSDTSDGEAATLQRDSDRYLLREGRSTASTPEETTI